MGNKNIYKYEMLCDTTLEFILRSQSIYWKDFTLGNQKCSS